MLNRIAVVVPAHDEAELLPGCLTALHDASLRIAAPVEIIIVADDCADDTAAIARDAGVDVVTVRARCVGVARAAGMRHALRHGTTGLWLATTDADSRVRPDWFTWHLAHPADVLVGTVAVHDWTPWPTAVRDAYEVRYRSTISHVHGANLGCAADAYEGLGGFAAVDHDEDLDLVTRATMAGLRVVYDSGSPVGTSARRTARAPAGFAAHLTLINDGFRG